MFTDDLNENWDSNAVQDAFIENYFGKKLVTKAVINCDSEMPNKLYSGMNCKNKNKAQKRKYSSEVSCNNDNNILILNDSFEKKAKKKKKAHDNFPKNSDVVNLKIERNLDNESFNESQNGSFNLGKKEKRNKMKLKKSDKQLSQNKVRLNSHAIDKSKPVLSSSTEKKRKRKKQVSNSSSQNEVINFEENIKLDNQNFKDSANGNSLSRKEKKKMKKKLKNKNKNLHQNDIYSTLLIKDKSQSELNKSFKEKGQDKEILVSSTKKDSVSFREDIKQNFTESLGVDSNPMKKKKVLKKKDRNKKLLQNQMPSNSCDLASYQENNFKSPSEESERESDGDLSSKKSTLFQNKAYKKLQAAKFRYLNEMLYTNTGKDALKYFQQNTDEFQDYHTGYQVQVSKWPLNPVDVIIKELRQMSKSSVIVDLGCGEARIAEVLSNRVVHSFDLIALKNCVTACDIANVPLTDQSVDVAVFCLSLMGTNWKDYLLEARRILKLGGALKIAEIESRIENLSGFIKNIECYGFSLVNKNVSHKMFIFMNFKKVKKNAKSSKVKSVILKPWYAFIIYFGSKSKDALLQFWPYSVSKILSISQGTLTFCPETAVEHLVNTGNVTLEKEKRNHFFVSGYTCICQQ